MTSQDNIQRITPDQRLQAAATVLAGLVADAPQSPDTDTELATRCYQAVKAVRLLENLCGPAIDPVSAAFLSNAVIVEAALIAMTEPNRPIDEPGGDDFLIS